LPEKQKGQLISWPEKEERTKVPEKFVNPVDAVSHIRRRYYSVPPPWGILLKSTIAE
jgi:hypothetical protein